MKKYFSLIIIIAALGTGLNAQTQTRPMRAGGQVGIAFPLGDIGDAYSIGFSFNGLFIYNLQPQLDLTGSLGYMRLGSESIDGIDVDASWSSVPLLVGARYSFAGTSGFTPYVGGEIGLFFTSFSTTFSDPFFGGTFTASESETEFAFVPQGGFTYPVTPALLLDVNLKLNFILSGGTGTIFGINAGLTYGL